MEEKLTINSPKGKRRLIINLFLLSLIVAGIVYVAFFDENQSKNDADYKFIQKGYYKEDNTKFRLFTFNVVGVELINDELHKDLEKHASEQAHSEGAVTYVFYYKGNAPDVTLSYDADAAWEKAIVERHLSWVHIMPNGEIQYNEGD